jgi:hypothetical protein
MIGLERDGSPAIGGEKGRDAVSNTCCALQPMGLGSYNATGTETPPGTKKQFLTSMDPEIIRRIKAAAALRDKTASVVLEEAAKEWLERHLDGKK